MEFFKNIFKKFNEKFLSKLHKKQKIYLGVFILIAGILLWAFITAGVITHNFSRSVLNSSNSNQQAVEVSSMIINESNKGQKMFEIYGETGNYSSDHKIANLNNVIGNFYKNNQVNMSFQSSHCGYNEDTKDLTMYQNTLIVLSNNVSIKADRVTYYSKSRNIVAKGHVIIYRNNGFISTAREAIVDSDYNSFRLVGNAKTKIYSSGNDLKGK